MQLLDHIAAGLIRQVTRRFVWAPIFFAAGIGLYFGLKFEPSALMALCVLCAVVLCGAFGAWRGGYTAIVANVLVLVGLGLVWAAVQAQWVAEPVLQKRHYGPVQGVVYARDVSGSGNMRLWLRNVHLPGVTGARPTQVRVSLARAGDWAPEIGQTIQVTAHLSPPPAPAEPGGFDFQRHAWFLKLGAVGYARAPPVLWEHPQVLPLSARTEALRHKIADGLMSRMPEQTAGVAVAISVGLRHGLQDATQDTLRKANLAHLLAISGLHMGLLTAIIFFCVRAVLALHMRLNIAGLVKPMAAVAALAAGAGYLVLSGQSIATERAFAMAAVAFLAILLGRRALNLRALAVAMWIVLLIRPQALLSPGFQMSFAATCALIVGFGWLQKTGVARLPAPVRWVVYSIASAAFAGMATAPFAAAHFNMLPHYGIVANVFAVPLMGMVVMPGMLLALVGLPFGLEGVGLWVADQGLRWIMAVAETVVAWDGSFTLIKAPSVGVLPIVAIGFVAALLLLGWSRLIGCAVLGVGVTIWIMTPRPDVLIADSGNLVGTMTSKGRHISKEKGQGFVARVWLENDGDAAFQKLAHGRKPAKTFVTVVKDVPAGDPDCTAIPMVVAKWVKPSRCDVIDLRILSRTGSQAGYLLPNGALQWQTARSVSGRRLWNDRFVRREGWLRDQ